MTSATLYEQGAKRGHVHPRYVAGQATLPVSITEVRQRLLCLYSGLVVDKAGQIKPLAGRKPSEALFHERTMYGHKQG
jgi:hypothetical protein